MRIKETKGPYMQRPSNNINAMKNVKHMKRNDINKTNENKKMKETANETESIEAT